MPGRIPSCFRASVFLWMHSNRMENNCRIYGNRSENEFRLGVHIGEHQSDRQQDHGVTPHMLMGTQASAGSVLAPLWGS